MLGNTSLLKESVQLVQRTQAESKLVTCADQDTMEL